MSEIEHNIKDIHDSILIRSHEQLEHYKSNPIIAMFDVDGSYKENVKNVIDKFKKLT